MVHLMEHPAPKYEKVRNILSILDILLAVSIIITASRIMETAFGSATLIFGFIMLAITTTLRIFQKW